VASTPPTERDGGDPVGHGETAALDACVIINLCASRRVDEILADLPHTFVASGSVLADETLYVRRGGGGEDAGEKDVLDLQPLISSGVLTLLSIAGEEEQADYVTLAAELDDGEAITIAIARNRRFGVATDDRKARRILAQSQTRIYSTLQLLREWCEMRELTAAEISSLLMDVRDRGQFVPPRGDPEQVWWDAHV
jgi:predicted nucleic acid-binding protein